MHQYQELLKKIIKEGDVTFNERTGVSTIGISGASSTYDLRDGFPLVTTKEVPPRLPTEELLWKLRGERNVGPLVERNVHIWTGNAFDLYVKRKGLGLEKHSAEWDKEFKDYVNRIKEDQDFATREGDLGPVYGNQWRHWKRHDGKEIDQLRKVLEEIKENPGSRYHILSAWNVSDLSEMALPPCPFWHQFTVYGDNLDLTVAQRSCDTYLGVPFNIAQDALLLELVAKETELNPRLLNHHTFNTHIYLGRPPRSSFWSDGENIKEFIKRFSSTDNSREGYVELKSWYLENSSPEEQRDERKDHIPFVLEQLSKEPRKLPTLELIDIPFLEAIEKPFKEIAKVRDYNPHKWDSKATMAI